MRPNEIYQSNKEGTGGVLKYNNNAQETLTVVERYDVGKLCGLCYYYDENNNPITKEVFLENFLPKNSQGELEPLYTSFDVTIDQSNNPQVLIVRPNLGTQDRGRRLIASLPFGKKVLDLFKVRERNLGKEKDAA